ncbi:hypothetical protein [Vibrio variabilis]|uniref:hypothetical protein n=1 Tax=Vibrio variabilis TaxID=990271 RepID=UPI000DD513F6|nr:hypothetical protein [Vibrio variabilis]
MYSDLLESQPKNKSQQPPTTQRRDTSSKPLSDKRADTDNITTAQRQPHLIDNRLMNVVSAPLQRPSNQASQPKLSTNSVVQRAKVPNGFDPDAWESLTPHARAVYKLIAQSPNFDILRYDMGENKLIAECANLGMALELARSLLNH